MIQKVLITTNIFQNIPYIRGRFKLPFSSSVSLFLFAVPKVVHWEAQLPVWTLPHLLGQSAFLCLDFFLDWLIDFLVPPSQNLSEDSCSTSPWLWSEGNYVFIRRYFALLDIRDTLTVLGLRNTTWHTSLGTDLQTSSGIRFGMLIIRIIRIGYFHFLLTW